MAYIDVETQEADYRVILGYHLFSSSPKQIPEGTRAVVVETSFSSGAYQMMEGRFPQYSKIARHCREREIPIFAGEPDLDKQYGVPLSWGNRILYSGRDINLLMKISLLGSFMRIVNPVQFLPWVFSLEARASLGSFRMEEGDRFYESLVNGARRQNRVMFGTVDFRDNMQAHRAQVVEQVTRDSRSGKRDKRPVVVVSGSYHVGVAPKLREHPTQVFLRLANPATSYIYNPKSVGRIRYISYDPYENSWQRGSMPDPYFSEEGI
jgi:hypothetical protein